MGVDDGYFPRGSSILRRVHEERLVGLFYGQRALCIGALAPLNYVGTSEHSYAKLTPFRRLAHTGAAFEKIFFGSQAEADHVLGYVRRLHERVNGTLAADAGATPAGTSYSALDPDEMLWTVAAIADSAERFFELFVRRLSAPEREALWQDYVRFAELFGCPREACPQTHREFRDWWETRLASDKMFLTDEARHMGYSSAFEIPMPPWRQGGKRVHDAVMLGSLPPRVREIYGLRYGRRERAAFDVGVRLIRGTRRVAPRGFIYGSCVGEFEMVARTERRRIQRGRPTPQVRPGEYPAMAIRGAASGDVEDDLAGRAA